MAWGLKASFAYASSGLKGFWFWKGLLLFIGSLWGVAAARSVMGVMFGGWQAQIFEESLRKIRAVRAEWAVFA